MFATCILFVATPERAVAQITVGGGINAGTDDLGPGLTFTGTYGVMEKIRVAAGLSMYFPGEDANLWSFDINGQYTFLTQDKLNAYGLAGLNYTKSSVKVLGTTFDDSAVGLNLGAGADYVVGPGHAFTEFKFVAGDYDRMEIWVGFRYPLGGK